VALVAVDAVVDVSAHALVTRIGLTLGMTIRTLEYEVVTGISVAGGTHASRVAMIGRPPGMVEGRSSPRRGGMTRLAGCGETGSDMIRVRSGLIDRFMTGIAVCGYGRVIVVNVTICTGHRGVCSGQRERCVVVIER